MTNLPQINYFNTAYLPSVPQGATMVSLAFDHYDSNGVPILDWIAIHAITGPQGPPGGARGITGIQGVTGLQGSTGAQGATGIQGVQGSPAVTGAQGIQGSTGPQGLQGPAGAAQGATGIIGVTGPQGITGARGLQGATGVSGGTMASGNVSSYQSKTRMAFGKIASDGTILVNNGITSVTYGVGGTGIFDVVFAAGFTQQPQFQATVVDPLVVAGSPATVTIVSATSTEPYTVRLLTMSGSLSYAMGFDIIAFGY